MTQPDEADMHSRDLGTGDEDGPQLAQFETPGARDTGDPHQGMMEAERQRPRFSPITQPGTEVIHWHTVRTREPEHHEQPTRGMIGRLHPRRDKKKGKHRGR